MRSWKCAGRAVFRGITPSLARDRPWLLTLQAGLSVCTRVCTSNTDFGNDAAAPDKSLDPQRQLLIEAWPTLSKAVQQQIMLLVG